MACDNKLTADMLFDCANKPKTGITGSKAVLINYDDIDRSASALTKSTISDIVLASGTAGFNAEYYKDLGNAGSSFSPSADSLEGFLHDGVLRIMAPTAEAAERMAEIANGRYVIVVETKFKGASNAEAFKVLGWENGLSLSEATWRTNENSSSILYTISTNDGDVEDYPYYTFLETDYATSKLSFDAKFATI